MNNGAVLAYLLPESLAEDRSSTEPERWQQRKSRATREILLEAALQCLARDGYTATSLQAVAAQAEISRGAMLHHYESKLDLMAAVIEYIFYRRMADYLDRIHALTDQERAIDHVGIDISYRVCRTAAYAAYLELHTASRSNAELRQVFLERARRFDTLWRERIKGAFPEWADDGQRELLTDYVWSAVEGLALNADIWDSPEREAALLRFVALTIRAVRTGSIDIVRTEDTEHPAFATAAAGQRL